MNQPTYGSWFSSLGGADIGARAAGFELAWGCEFDAAIAEVGNFNLGNHIWVADVLNTHPRDFDPVDLAHFSPPCTRASNANNSAEVNEDGMKESPLDIALGKKIAELIRYHRFPAVTLENVYAYRKFKAFKIIMRALDDCGYFVDVQHVNSANYAVPQTRKRLMLRALRGSLVPMLPQPTRWIGWYEAIEDLIPTLPESQFAQWQLDRLSAGLFHTKLIDTAGYADKNGVFTCVQRHTNEPANCIVANHSVRPMKCFIVDGQPAYDDNKELLTRGDGEPMFSVTASQSKRLLRAFVMRSQNAGQEGGKQVRYQEEPYQTVVNEHKSGVSRAWLVGDQSYFAGVGVQLREAQNPSFTIRARSTGGGDIRSWLDSGRIVSMTPRALARFQSFPDWFQLPEKKGLACKGIGNAVPPLLYQALAAQLAEVLS